MDYGLWVVVCSFCSLPFQFFPHPPSLPPPPRRFIVTLEPKDDNITIFEEPNPAAGMKYTGVVLHCYEDFVLNFEASRSKSQTLNRRTPAGTVQPSGGKFLEKTRIPTSDGKGEH